MKRMRTNSVLLMLTIVVFLGSQAPILPADTINWDGSCSDLWSDCCVCNVDPCLRCNNWAASPEPVPCPMCPPYPNIDDDVVIGISSVTCDGGFSTFLNPRPLAV